MKIEFGDGKQRKSRPKSLQMMVTAHGKIQKPRDKEKFVAMISKSKRDMLNDCKETGKMEKKKMILSKECKCKKCKMMQMMKKIKEGKDA